MRQVRPGAAGRFAVAAWVLLTCAACAPSPREHNHDPGTGAGAGRPHRDEHGGVLEVARRGETPGASGGVSSTPLLGSLATVDVQPSSTVAPFSVLARDPRRGKAPCKSCHTLPLPEMGGTLPAGAQKAHWAIDLAHAPDNVMNCATCHDAADLDRLRTLQGSPVSFDHSYELCGQCHSGQRKDWEGGAHGKRVGGWAPPRVVYNCTECHDPHRPALEPRWPAHAGRARE